MSPIANQEENHAQLLRLIPVSKKQQDNNPRTGMSEKFLKKARMETTPYTKKKISIGIVEDAFFELISTNPLKKSGSRI